MFKLGKKANKTYEDIHYSCTVRFLDDSEPINVTFQKDTKGLWLIDHVCKELNLIESDYFGLRFVDVDKQRHWLDPLKPIYRQLKNVDPMVLCFRVKFYPTQPMKLKEELTRYFLFLQLRRDLHHGRLLCSQADANNLASYIVQSELGDYDPQDHLPGYVSQFKMLPKQNLKQEDKIAEIHKSLVGQVPADAEANFLKMSSTLDTYGVDPHPVKDQKGNQMYLGVTHLGIITFQGNKRTHLFKWAQIIRIAFEGKMFIVHVTISEGDELMDLKKSGKLGKNDKKKHACGFKCPTFMACKHLWKCAIEQQRFFTQDSSNEAPKVVVGGGLFSRRSKFRYSGRCQKEVYEESAKISREPPEFVRSASNPSFVRSYNKSKSASMPAKLRNHGEAVEDETNFNNSGVFPLSGEMVLNTEGDESLADEGIPEDEEVTIAEQSYSPLESPTKEEVPLPGDNDKDLTENHADLDSQIQQLQNELYKCKNDDTSHSSDILLSVNETKMVDNLSENKSNDVSSENEEPTQVIATKPKTGGCVSCCVATVVSLFLVATFFATVVYLLFESNSELPYVSDLRAIPEVQDFRERHYAPLRSTVFDAIFKN